MTYIKRIFSLIHFYFSHKLYNFIFLLADCSFFLYSINTSMVANCKMARRVPARFSEDNRRYTITLNFKRTITHAKMVRIRNSIWALARRQHRRIPNVEFIIPET